MKFNLPGKLYMNEYIAHGVHANVCQMCVLKVSTHLQEVGGCLSQWGLSELRVLGLHVHIALRTGRKQKQRGNIF